MFPPVSSESAFPIFIPRGTATKNQVEDDDESSDGSANADSGVEGSVVRVEVALHKKILAYGYHF